MVPIEIINRSDFYKDTIYKTNQGYYIKILKYFNSANVFVEFLNTKYKYTTNTTIDHIKSGKIGYPYHYKELYENTVWKTNEGYDIKILEYVDRNNIKIIFIYNNIILEKCRLDHIRDGKIKNPYHKNAYGGYIGIGKYTSTGIYENIYSCWYSMLQRTIKDPAYENVYICQEWYNYQNFAEWYYSKISLLNPEFDYELDKDIKQIEKIQKYYGPNTCCLVPKELNISLSHLYQKRYNKNIPVGVFKYKDKFKVLISINGIIHYYGIYNTIDEAFNAYYINKISYIKKLAKKYYENNGLIYEDYIEILNLKILPYKKEN